MHSKQSAGLFSTTPTPAMPQPFHLAPRSLRTRLLDAFILIVLLSGVAIGAITTWTDYMRQEQEEIADLSDVAALKEAGIKTWLASLHAPLSVVVKYPGMIDFARIVASGPITSPEYQDAHTQLQHDLDHLLAGETRLFDRVLLIDLKGRVCVSTDPSLEGRDLSETVYFRRGLAEDYVDPPVYSPSLRDSSLVMVHRILDAHGMPIALLAGHARLSAVADLLGLTEGLHSTGQTFLVGSDGTMLTPPRSGGPDVPGSAPLIHVNTEGFLAAKRTQGSGYAFYTDYRGVPVIGVYRWIPELQVALLAEQDQSETFTSSFALLRSNAIVTGLVMLFAIVAALYLVRNIIAPLEELTGTAARIEAGDLQVTARVARDDEIGTLAQAFNRMTARLRRIIADLEGNVSKLERTSREEQRLLQELRAARDELEARVQERTAELAQALEGERQAHRVADMLRDATMALSRSLELDAVLENLLDSLATLVPYDNASIMLLQTESMLAIRASRCSETGPASTARGMAFDFRKDIFLRRVMEGRESVLIPDADRERTGCGGDIRPDVKSWLGVPLVASGEVIGLCSLEHSRPGFFNERQLRLAETMAAQAGVAIQNAWLFEQVGAGRERMQHLSRRLVEVQEAERRYIARELHDEAGQALAGLKMGLWLLEEEAGEGRPIAARAAQLRHIADEVLENLHRVAMNLRPASLDHLGLLPALEEYIHGITQRYGLAVELDASGFDGSEVALAIETAFYRIVQEALHNVVRHAQATRAEVILTHSGGRVTVKIGDNGIGFDLAEAMQKQRLGLLGIRERAEMLGGKLTVESAPGQGTTIIVDVPYDDSHSHR